MIIHQPELISKNGYTTVFSRTEVNNKVGFFPEFIWYRVPEQYGSFLTTQSDAFLVPGLLAGMYFGDDIEVRGAVSPMLAYHLEEYQFLLRFQCPNYLNHIEIDFERLEPIQSTCNAVGSTFSGGVDSLFTIWKHLKKNQAMPDHQVTHGVFIKGFDILPDEDQHYQFMVEKYKQAAAQIGIELIPLETNMVSIIHQRLPLTLFPGPIIAAAGHALAGGFRRFFIPSSWDYQILKNNSSTANPLMDRLLSTDTLDIIHHGSTHRRVDKVREISNWEIAQKLLWVCEKHKFEKDHWNCSRCEKCLRSMIPIYTLGKMGAFTTFKKPLKSDRDLLWWARKFSPQRGFIREIFSLAKEHKPCLLPWLGIAAALGFLRYWLVIRLLPGSIKTWLRRYGYFTARNEAPNAYEVPEINQYIRGK